MSTVSTGPVKKPLKVGVLLVGAVQLLDFSPVDLFAMLAPEYLKACLLPEQIVALGQEIEFLYISGTKKDISGDSIESLTADVGVRVTHTVHSAGLVDVLLVPGPEPSYRITPEVASFLNAHVGAGRTLLVICTGILPAAMSGILDGLRATAPLGIVPIVKQNFPKVEWTERRWEVAAGGKIWTSGAVTNGTDMVAAYIKATFPPQLAGIVCALADVGNRDQEYSAETKKAVAALGFN